MPTIFLDKNENHYPHSPEVLSYLKRISPDVLNTYSPSVDPLMEKLSEQYHVPTESILLANGGEEILKSAILETVQATDRVLIPQGGWNYYRELVEQAGGEVLFFELEKTTHTYLYLSAQIEALLEQYHPKIMILASPNNPTGNTISPDTLVQLLEKAQKSHTRVILDEAYMGFGALSLSYQKIQEDYPHLLVVRTFSKFFSLAGLRIGFGFWGSDWKNLGKRYQRYLGFSHLSSNIALEALSSFSHYENNARQIVQEREGLVDFLRSHQVQTYDSEANFLLCSLDAEMFSVASKVFSEHGIQIKFFSAHKERWFESCIRITIGLQEENRRVQEAFLKTFEQLGR